MDQYFERMKMFMDSPELPSRIKFMLLDVIELRENKVRHRIIPQTCHNPKSSIVYVMAPSTHTHACVLAQMCSLQLNGVCWVQSIDSELR